MSTTPTAVLIEALTALQLDESDKAAAHDLRAAAIRLEELERENARLREALKPFADEGEQRLESLGTEDAKRLLGISLTGLMVEHLNAARAALAGSGEK